jgi:hypothetical protein
MDIPSRPRKKIFGTTDIRLPSYLEIEENAPPTGCSKRPSRKAAASEDPEAYPLGYVEDLSDARTMLTGFFSSLL